MLTQGPKVTKHRALGQESFGPSDRTVGTVGGSGPRFEQSPLLGCPGQTGGVTRRVRSTLQALRAAQPQVGLPHAVQPRATQPRGAAATPPAAAGDALTVVGALAVLNVVRHLVPAASTWVGATASLVLVAHARRRGLSWAQLGMSRDRVRSGGLWGLGTIAAVGAVYLVGVLVPRTRPAFLDSRHDVALPEALSTAFVGIPLGTVLREEVAFRSVLPGLLARHTGAAKAHALSSALFGLWHVRPSLHFASARGMGSARGPGSEATAGGQGGKPTARTTVPVVLGTVAFTAVGGAVAAQLRRRSDSVLASAGMHWATNGLGVLFGLAARRLASPRLAAPRLSAGRLPECKRPTT